MTIFGRGTHFFLHKRKKMSNFAAELCTYLNFRNKSLTMRKISYLLSFALMTLLASCSAHEKVPYVVDAETIPAEALAQLNTLSEPILAPGDLLNIEVTSSNMADVVPFNKGYYITEQGQIQRTSSQTNMSNQADASTDYYLVNSDGTIDFPIIGRIKAAGVTKLELAQYISDAIYPKYVREQPKVEVRLMNFRVVVCGAVKSPGIYQSRNERMNFFEALALAGDLDIRGDRENILLYRTNADGSRELHRLNIHEKDFLLSPYFVLQQNDVIYVTPNKSLANTAWQLNPGVSATITMVGGVSSLASLVIGIINLTKD